VLITRRPKYACRTCEDGVVQTPTPARLIEGGLPTEATVAQVLVSKYADHQSASADRSRLMLLPGIRVRCMSVS
jgi:transposase